MLVMSGFGVRAVIALLVGVSLLTIAVTTAMLRASGATVLRKTAEDVGRPAARSRVAAIVALFVALQATNAAAVAVMTPFFTPPMHLPGPWACVALGGAAP